MSNIESAKEDSEQTSEQQTQEGKSALYKTGIQLYIHLNRNV